MSFLIVEIALHHAEDHVIAWFVGGMFMLLAVPLSIQDIMMHLLHYTRPALQRFIVRILFMVRRCGAVLAAV